MSQTAHLVVKMEYAYRTIKMTTYDASVAMVIQENFAVSEISVEQNYTQSNCRNSLQICLFVFQSVPPKTCAQLLQDGFTSSGAYTINPDGGKPIQVLCDMTTDGGGWTVFQKRLDGSVDFYLGWESYKNGFGDLNGEFWLGNDNLHRLTAADDVILRVDLEDFDGNIRYVEYTTFKVADEGDKYRLWIGGHNGTAGDSMGITSGIVAKYVRR